jgi:hypothetical protein
MRTEQSEKWGGDFGREYAGRNPRTIGEFDELYEKQFGTTRTKMNAIFLENLPRDLKILEVGCNVGAQLDG